VDRLTDSRDSFPIVDATVATSISEHTNSA
jgi:hypothetical protein